MVDYQGYNQTARPAYSGGHPYFQMCLWEQKRCHLIGVYVQFTPVSIAFIRKKVKKRSHPTGQIRDQIILPNVQAIHNKLAQTRGRKHLPIFCFFFASLYAA